MNNISSRSLINKIKKNIGVTKASWMMAEQVGGQILGIIVNIFFSRKFGPQGYGAINYAIAFTGVFQSIALFGIDSILVKDFAQECDENDKKIGSALFITCISSVVCFIIGIIFAFYRNVDNTIKVYIFVLFLLVLFSPLNCYKYYIISNGNIKKYSISLLIKNIIFSVIKVYFILANLNILLYVIAYVCSELVSWIIVLFFFSCDKSRLIYSTSFKYVVKYVKLGIPYMAASLAVTLYMKVDQLMVGELLGEYELGLYSLAVSLSEMWYIVPTVLFTAYLPMLSRKYEYSQEEYYYKLQMFGDVLSFIGLGACFMVALLAKPIILLVYGNVFSGSVNIVRIYAWGGWILSVGKIYSIHTTIKEMATYSLIATISGCVINVGLNYWLIPLLGAYGATIATIAVYVWGVFMFNALGAVRNFSIRKMLIIQIKALFPFIRLISYVKG